MFTRAADEAAGDDILDGSSYLVVSSSGRIGVP